MSYEQKRKEACELCAKGVKTERFAPQQHVWWDESDRFHAKACTAPTESAYIAELERDKAQLLYLLWRALDDGTAYGDDGEMQLWGIDFKRNSVAVIGDAVNFQWLRRASTAMAAQEQRNESEIL